MVKAIVRPLVNRTCRPSTTHLGPPSSVPRTQQVDTSGEEPGLEEPEDDSQSDERLPVLDEPDGEGSSSPEDGDGRQEVSGADFTEEKVGWEFKDDV